MNSRLRSLQPRRAVVLFPSGLTLANLFFGVFAIVAASRGEYQQAGLWVVCGGIADAFDGRVARATGTGGKFGEELDSLVDAITFGLAPALIMYFAVLNRDGWDWVWAFFFTACAVLRLARFNVVQAGTSKSYFQGLPTPAAGITLATYYWFSQSTLYTETIADWPWHQLLRVVMGGLSFLMISNVPYPVVPNLSVKSLQGWIGILFLVGGVTLLVTGQFEYFFPLAVAYIAFGLVRGVLVGWTERRRTSDAVDDTVLQHYMEGEEEVERYPEADPEPRRGRGSSRGSTPPSTTSSTTLEEDPGGLESAAALQRKKRRRRRGGRTGERGERPERPDRPGRGDRGERGDRTEGPNTGRDSEEST
jgi:CDP-diacylglycerol---serine O-phosphatidyltransferase